MRTIPVLALIAAGAAAQSPLATPFTTNNGGMVDGAVYFNIRVLNEISIGAFELNCNVLAGGAPGSADFWFAPFNPAVSNGYQGNIAAGAAFWGAAPDATSSFEQQVFDTPTFAPLSSSVHLLPGWYAIAIVAHGFGHSYNNGTGSNLPGGGATANQNGGFNQYVANSDLQLFLGEAGNVPFTNPTFAPRVASIAIHYVPGPGPAIAAATEVYGKGCYDVPTTLYEDFDGVARQLDLAGSGFRLVPNNGGYLLVAATGAFAPPGPGAMALGIGDDQTVIHPLRAGFEFPYPGSYPPVTEISICSNGFVAAGRSMDVDWTPTPGELLAGDPRWCPAWRDLQPDAQGEVWVEEVGAATVVTWTDVPNWGLAGASSNSFSISFAASGVVEVRYGTMDPVDATLTGFSTARGAANPGGIDLSASLGQSLAFGGSLAPRLGAGARPRTGTSIGITTRDLDPATMFGAWLISLGRLDPGIELTALGVPAPGCRAHINLAANATLALFFPLGADAATVPFAIPPGFAGIDVFVQSAQFVPGANAAGVTVSNGLHLRTGNL